MENQPTQSGGTAPAVVSDALLGSVLLVVEAGVRYWEDATVNGQEDTEGTLIPCRSGELWKPLIELATGKIRDWPKGTTADIHYKICDAGQYWLADEAGNKLAKWDGDYVPDHILAIGDSGYGDYIIMKVNADGIIEGWHQPDIREDGWERVPNVKDEPRDERG